MSGGGAGGAGSRVGKSGHVDPCHAIGVCGRESAGAALLGAIDVGGVGFKDVVPLPAAAAGRDEQVPACGDEAAAAAGSGLPLRCTGFPHGAREDVQSASCF